MSESLHRLYRGMPALRAGYTTPVSRIQPAVEQLVPMVLKGRRLKNGKTHEDLVGEVTWLVQVGAAGFDSATGEAGLRRWLSRIIENQSISFARAENAATKMRRPLSTPIPESADGTQREFASGGEGPTDALVHREVHDRIRTHLPGQFQFWYECRELQEPRVSVASIVAELGLAPDQGNAHHCAYKRDLTDARNLVALQLLPLAERRELLAELQRTARALVQAGHASSARHLQLCTKFERHIVRCVPFAAGTHDRSPAVEFMREQRAGTPGLVERVAARLKANLDAPSVLTLVDTDDNALQPLATPGRDQRVRLHRDGHLRGALFVHELDAAWQAALDVEAHGFATIRCAGLTLASEVAVVARQSAGAAVRLEFDFDFELTEPLPAALEVPLDILQITLVVGSS